MRYAASAEQERRAKVFQSAMAYTKDFQVHMCGHLPALDTRLLPTERAELHPVADVRWGSQRRCSHAWACPQAQDASV